MANVCTDCGEHPPEAKLRHKRLPDGTIQLMHLRGK